MPRQQINTKHQRRFVLMQEVGCVPCIIEGELRGKHRRGEPGDVNHLIYGYRRGHDFTVCECPWHHRGILKANLDALAMEVLFGPSRALNKRRFHARYGDDDTLLKRQNHELKKIDVWASE